MVNESMIDMGPEKKRITLLYLVPWPGHHVFLNFGHRMEAANYDERLDVQRELRGRAGMRNQYSSLMRDPRFKENDDGGILKLALVAWKDAWI